MPAEGAAKQAHTHPKAGHVKGGAVLRARSLRLLVLLLIIAAVLLLIPVSVGTGAVSIPWQTVIDGIFHFDAGSTQHLLIRNLRLPRALVAVVVGAALGCAGGLMQAMTRNPLADPGVLGINAGAAFAVAFSLSVLGISAVGGYLWIAIVGSAASAIGVYLLGGVRSGTDPIRLVLSGTALSVVLAAATQLLLVNSAETVYDNYRQWMVGSLQGRSWEELACCGAMIAAGLVLSLALTRALDVAVLGKDLSESLGVNTKALWGITTLAVLMLSAAATAAAGPISFVGLVAPHVARLLVGPVHKWLLPYTIALSGLLVLAADILGKTVIWPKEISVGIMVALVGGPFFVALVCRRKMIEL